MLENHRVASIFEQADCRGGWPLILCHEQRHGKICEHFCQDEGRLPVPFRRIENFAGEDISATLMGTDARQKKDAVLPNRGAQG
jgi:hypothetical protein